ncbi:sugar-binding protein [Phycisphaera mikurensis]|uniref:Carbohydrate-binding domain-containing protein n=1 Tax=Phycisphaera mikurensis (strain NBRC 102666 / KCTC 22515 / FYK2301M01) TaxID=1142394 RepID=I0ICP7_PHYMF|nr:sugar-binding protein [Phycisphaera mikurensis]MBB6442092.1 hypothetical protein [Phycisphaera mikurensis]BAM03035.1 hypothetical protein PSMK_08760 [Phycisphaera mikurensis NBRC 102666]
MRNPRLLCLTLAVAVAPVPSAWAEPEKKLIQLGWDGGTPGKMLANLERMKAGPFDGYVFKLPEVDADTEARPLPLQNLFTTEPHPAALFEPHLEDMRTLKERGLGNMTHNMVKIWCTGRDGWDWFNDDHWAAAEENWRNLVKLASVGDADIMFDPESYYTKIEPNYFWVFNHQDNPRADEKTIGEYEEVVRQRGRQFVRALAEVDPDIDILSMYGLNKTTDAVLNADSPAEADAALEAQLYYNLLPAFVAGVLEEAHDGFTFHDGNEMAYYYTSPEEFEHARERMKGPVRRALPPDAQKHFDDHYRAAQAIYASDLFPYDADDGAYRAFFRTVMPRDRQAELLAHNVYHALATADEYAWYYNDGAIDNWTGDVPAGMHEAIRRARGLLEAGEPFPPGMVAEVEAAKEAYQRQVTGDLHIATADLTSVSTPPRIDGDVDDAAWKETQRHGPMHALSSNPTDQPGEDAFVRVAADAENLYVLVEAMDDRTDHLDLRGDGRDGDVWAGDDVEVAVSDPDNADRFFLFMVNPAGTIYDAELRVDAEGELSFDTGGYDPDWQRAVEVHDDRWVVEIAIPWSAVGGRPRNDQPLRMNVARSFGDRPGPGFVSWSQTIDSFLTPAHFAELRPAGN